MSKWPFLIVVACAAVVCFPRASSAQPSSSGSWNGLPHSFQVDTGLFRVKGNTVLEGNLGGAGSSVDFEDDLGLTPTAYTFWVDTTWRVGRRHQLKLGYTRLTRETNDYTIGRAFTWEGETYTAGLLASSDLSTSMWSGYYRFALVSRERFEAGPAVGVGWLDIDAGIKASAGVSGPGGASQGISLDERAALGQITGDVGAYFSAWLAPRLALRGDLLYIIVKPGDSTASLTDGRLSLDAYPLRHVGVGVQYKYNKFRYDRAIGTSGLGGFLTYQGAQVYASFLF